MGQNVQPACLTEGLPEGAQRQFLIPACVVMPIKILRIVRTGSSVALFRISSTFATQDIP